MSNTILSISDTESESEVDDLFCKNVSNNSVKSVETKFNLENQSEGEDISDSLFESESSQENIVLNEIDQELKICLNSNHSDSEIEETMPEIIQMLFIQRKKRKRLSHLNEEENVMVESIINQMDNAALNDIESNKNGLPAIYKIAMLDKVVKFLSTFKYQELFLRKNGSSILAR